MNTRRWLRVSLARKISLLFGSSVLLIICVTLLFPWMHMGNLNEEAMLERAHRVATAASQAVDLHQPDWTRAQAQLTQQWPVLLRNFGLPGKCPVLIRADTTVSASGFRREAMTRLQSRPYARHYWKLQESGRQFRFALAVRGADSDPHPNTLVGFIDVSLPVSQANVVWNQVVTGLAGASGAVLAILAFYLVTQRLVLTPVSALRQATERVTTGDMTAQAKIESGDEFQDLSLAFNEMLSHLRQAQEDLQKTNRSLDIKLGELAERNVALYESNQLKREFLTNVSHELRTPLVSIIGFAELLRDAWGDPSIDTKRLRRYSENILTSGRGLLDIINDLLDLAKIEAGRMELHLGDFVIATLCGDLIDFVTPLAEKKEHTLSLEIEPDLPACHSDEGKIKQILYNLLSNAVKFTPEGGKITLRVSAGDIPDTVMLVVEDTGVGVPEDKRASIFEKFYQLDASKTREYEGTGLGLTITKELVGMLGGTIRLDDGPEVGAMFVVQLPVHITHSRARVNVRLT